MGLRACNVGTVPASATLALITDLITRMPMATGRLHLTGAKRRDAMRHSDCEPLTRTSVHLREFLIVVVASTIGGNHGNFVSVAIISRDDGILRRRAFSNRDGSTRTS